MPVSKEMRGGNSLSPFTGTPMVLAAAVGRIWAIQPPPHPPSPPPRAAFRKSTPTPYAATVASGPSPVTHPSKIRLFTRAAAAGHNFRKAKGYK